MVITKMVEVCELHLRDRNCRRMQDPDPGKAQNVRESFQAETRGIHLFGMWLRCFYEPAKVVYDKTIYVVPQHLGCFLIDHFHVDPYTFVVVVKEAGSLDDITHAFETIQCTSKLVFCRVTFEVNTIVFY